ncbi:multidrug efflux system subunit MdtA [Pseudogulbenkiania sp. NH8B]|uniref:MdtA/MuxA family multidrug efflux RND transporter periplasmic adaptor subunit n=1 Tax=Pseudogulbenkiania sp. (strain NH8B) TaxID=748280 RepID=UPI000227976B|nr:MdtA/MuxA family multidrug efflux RND transporter periplasmic adaptor subunit [Pseudogulbenkiania sp. NH8B]BAK74890.1 multidrug efflux system subunit MdtA [Pseudogulbenkiania sp. NH8B]
MSPTPAESTPPSSPSSPRPRRRLLWLALFGLVVAGAVGWQRWHAASGADKAAVQKRGERGPQTVTVATVKRGQLKVYLTALGTVTPSETVTVKSRVDGQLMRVLFTEGQLVKSGQLLAEIDPRPFEAALAQAEGQQLRDSAQLKNAEIDLARYQSLLAENSIARQQVDTQAALVQQFRGTVKVDQGVVDNARLQLSYSHITAPLAGRVGLRRVDAGNMITANDANGLVVITQTQPSHVVFALPEAHLSTVMKPYLAGQALSVEAWDRGGKLLAQGKLETLDNQMDSTTGTVKLKARFANADNVLFPNQFINVKLLTEVRRDAVLIPEAALQRGKDGPFVYLVQPDNRVALRPVVPGPADAGQLAVEQGLAPGERVALDGLDRLRAGSQVKPRALNDAGATAPAGGGKRRGKHAASAPAAQGQAKQ